MRRSSLISALLILTLSASVSTCITGSIGGAPAGCRRSHVRLSRVTTGDQCGDIVRSQTKQCSLRGMLQFQFLTLPSVRVAPPQQAVAEYTTPPVDPTIKFTSIGSPETDRGPPLS
jgi:hypothetical protein